MENLIWNDASKRNIGIKLPTHTLGAMHKDFAVPGEYCRLERDCMEYTFGEGIRVTGRYQWNDRAGTDYLIREGKLLGQISDIGTAVGGITLIASGVHIMIYGMATINIVGFLIGAGLFIGGYVVDWYQKSARDCLDRTVSNFILKEKRYELYRDTTLFGALDQGYGVRGW